LEWEILRHTLTMLAKVAPDLLCSSKWVERYSLRFEEYCLPKVQTERITFAETIRRMESLS
jgi:hypothetical protein